jgi:hypothetical protein
VDPAQQERLTAIRDNLAARIAEAQQEGWTGEAEGLNVSLIAAINKLAQIGLTSTRQRETVSLGMPAFRDVAARTLTTPRIKDHL